MLKAAVQQSTYPWVGTVNSAVDLNGPSSVFNVDPPWVPSWSCAWVSETPSCFSFTGVRLESEPWLLLSGVLGHPRAHWAFLGLYSCCCFSCSPAQWLLQNENIKDANHSLRARAVVSLSPFPRTSTQLVWWKSRKGRSNKSCDVHVSFCFTGIK